MKKTCSVKTPGVKSTSSGVSPKTPDDCLAKLSLISAQLRDLYRQLNRQDK